jgi:hypothetical protein
VKDKNCYLLAVSHKFLSRWKNYFSQLLNVHGVSNVSHTEIHISEQLVPNPTSSEFEIANANLKDTNRHVVVKFQRKRLKQDV